MVVGWGWGGRRIRVEIVIIGDWDFINGGAIIVGIVRFFIIIPSMYLHL